MRLKMRYLAWFFATFGAMWLQMMVKVDDIFTLALAFGFWLTFDGMVRDIWPNENKRRRNINHR